MEKEAFCSPSTTVANFSYFLPHGDIPFAFYHNSIIHSPEDVVSLIWSKSTQEEFGAFQNLFNPGVRRFIRKLDHIMHKIGKHDKSYIAKWKYFQNFFFHFPIDISLRLINTNLQ